MTDARGTVASVSVVVDARRSPTGSDVSGRVDATGVTLFGGRVTIASLRVGARGRADAAAAEGAVDGVQVGQVVVDGNPVAVAPGAPVDVPGAGSFVVGQSSREGGVVSVNALTVNAADSPGLAPLVIGNITLTTAPGADAVSPPDPAPAPARTNAPAPARTPAAPAPASAEPGRPDGADVIPPAAAPSAPVAPRVLPTPHLLPGTPPPSRAPVTGGVRGNVFPVQGAYTYSSDYGAPRAGTGWHHGNDVFAPVSTPVVAVADGVLSKVGWNNLGGNRLWLTDAGGTSYYYAHLSAYSTSAADGAIVRAGDVIGYVGNTGQASTTPPHLHFEIHPGGVPAPSINPYPFLQAWEASVPRTSFGIAQSERGDAPAPVADAGAGAVIIGVVVDRPTAPRVGDGSARSAR
ncbi:MAG: M23 family metallopeptidase [Thermoleophilia bacterium]|nr:M23 family metallopeptidase [Thermoleophilia bacterium]